MHTAIDIKDYRNNLVIRLENLSRITLFVGDNGSGKTMTLEAIQQYCLFSKPRKADPVVYNSFSPVAHILDIDDPRIMREWRGLLGHTNKAFPRLLRIANAMVSAKNSVLLADEIETGFHYTAMTPMWKLILDIAAKLDVQVFASTHSKDCWTSLGEALAGGNYSDAATILRLEAGGQKVVQFSATEIVAAAEANIEIR